MCPYHLLLATLVPIKTADTIQNITYYFAGRVDFRNPNILVCCKKLANKTGPRGDIIKVDVFIYNCTC